MGFPKKPEEEKYKRMNITLPPDLNERLEEYCKKDGRKKSWCIQKAIEEWLDKKDE